MSFASSRRRAGAGLAAAAVAVSLAVVTPPTGAAEPQPTAGLIGATTAQPAGSPATAITLITGDRVLVSTGAHGTPSATIGSGADFYTRRVNDDLYVIPFSAEPALAANRLDVELFNVTSLIEQGYDDANSATLPLIVEGALPRARGVGPTAVEVETALPSIASTAVSVAKDHAATAYAQLLGTTAARSVPAARTADKVWLDAKLQPSAVDLDPGTGVAQTGAPQAWELGYDGTGTKVAVLDTGYDATHPDLGQVTATEDFTGEGVQDYVGHGTHVASTIAGTGTADPRRVGMAPKADLLIGKVLGFGGGQESWIIAGMQWAVAQGADVVNMSLGTDQPTDCTDPIAQAAQALSEQTRTLFVVAAGNSGVRETVSSPGCAEGVLTVGAVDSEGRTASFSSRGATLGDHRLKPDIAAPGVDIVGAALNSPGGIRYTRMSGTSMATPHVVGAAALVHQAHPDWTAQQVKAALVGSVKDHAQDTVYDQGAGELWVPGAIASSVSSDVSVELGSFDWPHGRDEVATKQVTYTNSSARPVKLHLDVQDVTGADGERITSRAIELIDHNVTVPAHGTATARVVARGDLGDLRDSAYGEIGGRIIAQAKGGKDAHVTTAVGFWLEPKTVTVTIKGIDRNGAAATSGFLDFTDLHQPARSLFYFDGSDLTMRVRAGSYFASAFIATVAADGKRSYAYVGDPQVSFTTDTTLTLDARTARQITVETDRPTTVRAGSIGMQRSWDRWLVSSSVVAGADPTFYAAPSERVQDGDFTFGSYLRAYDPTVDAKNSGYVYNLAFTDRDRVAGDQSHRVSARDLATVDEHWYAQRPDGWAPEEWVRVVNDNGAGPFVASSAMAITPGTRTAYYTPEVGWQQLASASGFRTMPETWFDPVRQYERGEHSDLDWFKLPSIGAMNVNVDGSPARVAERQGSIVGFGFAFWKDSVAGRVGVPGFADIGNLQLWKDGTELGRSAFPSGQWDVGDGAGQLKVQLNQFRINRGNVWELGRAAVTRFEFGTSRPDGEQIEALPVSLPQYDAPVDQLNTGPAAADFPVDVRFIGQDGYNPGEIGEFTAKVTFDPIDVIDVASGKAPESYHWTEVPVVHEDGHWVALVDNSAASGATASLWVTATDSHGTKIEQFDFGAYGVR
jgi:subtilisin family serine protease